MTLKRRLEKRVRDIKDDLERNGEEYDNLNVSIRKLEIIKLEERILQFN